MKKLFYLFLFVGLALTSCNKPESLPLEQDVIFKASELTTGFKAGDICDNDAATSADITIQTVLSTTDGGELILGDPVIKTIDIFYLNNIMYTNTIKLTPGDYVVTYFMLYDEAGDPVLATPETGSILAQLTDAALPVPFTVGAFAKNEVRLDVFCIDGGTYTNFGFSWFQFNIHHIGSDLVFFGDLCTKYYEQYTDTRYTDKNPILYHDLVAVFQIEVFKDSQSLGIYNNESVLNGFPLEVPNPDNGLNDGEHFSFELSILVKVGDGFEYKPFYTWTRVDKGYLLDSDGDIFASGTQLPNTKSITPSSPIANMSPSESSK